MTPMAIVGSVPCSSSRFPKISVAWGSRGERCGALSLLDYRKFEQPPPVRHAATAELAIDAAERRYMELTLRTDVHSMHPVAAQTQHWASSPRAPDPTSRRAYLRAAQVESRATDHLTTPAARGLATVGACDAPAGSSPSASGTALSESRYG